MTRTSFTLCVAVAALAAAFPADAKPNFSGNWKMVAEKSDFGPMPAPTSYEQKIDHDDPDLKVTISQKGGRGDQTNDFVYHTKGKETSNDMRGGQAKSKARWQGDVLMIESKLDIQGNVVTMADSYELAADGATLTFTRKVATPNGDLNVKIVMAKQ
jgi:hypothetical protein